MSDSNPSKPVVLCGEERIDTLFRDTTAPALASTDRGAIAVVQDLLAGHGFNSMPGLLSPHRGTFGPSTATAVRTFQ
ncbi:MAG: hypothetical protein H7Y20_16490, partial [Bryobacteraceae bacterium]|nr:hypothetical protein [Bryobacteraceae bacterium]